MHYPPVIAELAQHGRSEQTSRANDSQPAKRCRHHHISLSPATPLQAAPRLIRRSPQEEQFVRFAQRAADATAWAALTLAVIAFAPHLIAAALRHWGL